MENIQKLILNVISKYPVKGTYEMGSGEVVGSLTSDPNYLREKKRNVVGVPT